MHATSSWPYDSLPLVLMCIKKFMKVHISPVTTRSYHVVRHNHPPQFYKAQQDSNSLQNITYELATGPLSMYPSAVLFLNSQALNMLKASNAGNFLL